MGIESTLGKVDETWKKYNGLLSASNQMDGAWSTTFRSTDDRSHGRTSVTERMGKDKDVLKILEATYNDSMATAKMAGDQEEEIKLLEDALKKLENVNGDLENAQIKAQIESIRVSLAIKKNLLLSNLITVKATAGKAKIDQEIKDNEATREGAAFSVNDPYHPTESAQKKFTRPKGQGMIDF